VPSLQQYPAGASQFPAQQTAEVVYASLIAGESAGASLQHDMNPMSAAPIKKVFVKFLMKVV